jgi:hypothetical protein
MAETSTRGQASKAIWTGLIGSFWGVAGTLGLLPEGLR